MSETSSFLKILNVGMFIVLTFFGIIYIFAAAADYTLYMGRLIIGITLIGIAIFLLVVISLVIQRRQYKVVKVIKTEEEEDKTKFVPSEMVCRDCNTPLEISKDMKKRDNVFCENCGVEIKIPKDKVNW